MTAPRRILYVHHGSGQGGAAVSLATLIRHLDRERFTPVVAADPRKPRAMEYFSDLGIRTVPCEIERFVHTATTWAWYMPRGLAKLLRWWLISRPKAAQAVTAAIERVDPDIVHFNGVSLLPYAPIVSRRGLPLVQHVREPVNRGVFGIRRNWLRALAERHVDRIVYICQDNANRFPVAGTDSTVIYNPVDLARFDGARQNDCRRELGIAAEAGVILFPAGANAVAKGIVSFRAAIERLRAAGRNVVALVPGEGFPFIDAVERYYSACDLVAAPFVVPHFSRAVIEAGAARRAVVASRIGGIEEVIVDGETGTLVEPGDEHALAAAFAELLDRPGEAMRMGEAGRAMAERKFDAGMHADAISAVYDGLMGGGR